MQWIDRDTLELDRRQPIVQAEDLPWHSLQPVLAIRQIRPRQTATGAGAGSISEIAARAHQSPIRTKKGNIRVIRRECNHMLVRVHTQRRLLRVVGHIGKINTRVRRALHRASIRWRIRRKDLGVLHRAADPHGIRMTRR